MDDPPNEPQDMQPRVMDILHALAEVLSSWLVIKDTHTRDSLKQPTAMIDCVGLASNLSLWTQLVVPIELRLLNEHVALLGRLIDRCSYIFEQQPQRVHVYAVAITVQSVEVFKIRHAPEGRFLVAKSAPHPLSICRDSTGLQLLARVLQASRMDHGYQVPELPSELQCGALTVRPAELIRQGTAPPGGYPGQFVFKASMDGSEAVTKLGSSDHEVHLNGLHLVTPMHIEQMP